MFFHKILQAYVIFATNLEKLSRFKIESGTFLNFVHLRRTNAAFKTQLSQKTTNHTRNMKVNSETAKLALYKNVFILFKIIICFPNKSHTS